MNDYEELQCPFCKEREFDDIGLKHHLLHGGCEHFEKVEPIPSRDAAVEKGSE